jgi:uncharacterized membrane protein YfcA
VIEKLNELNPENRSRLSFLYAVPIALLGGLMGLGGAEFRLPVLAGPLGYPARQAVPLNLAVSLVTILTAFLTRGRTLSLAPVPALWPIIAALIMGAVVAAFFGTALVQRVTNAQLEQVILIFLVTIGLALLVEAFLPQTIPGLLPENLAWRIAAGLGFGLAIGLVSSLLGVAGGELIIPTLIFVFGVEVKTAGTVSLLISLPTVLVGVMRYAGQGVFANRLTLRETVAPMSVGSVIGAVVGGLLVGLIPAAWLKFSLGLVLMISAWRIFRHKN